MDLTKTSLLANLAGRLQFLAARTSVLAENVANADTPGYVARDIEPSDFSARVSSNALKVSDPRHIASPQAAKSATHAHLSPDGEASLNGNKVSIETQMMKLSETRMDYQLASSVYRKSVDLIRLATRGGK